jgi:hypothetical protein
LRWDRQPADALSGRREDDLLSAGSDGGIPSHGVCSRLGTAAYRLRDFAEFGSPQKFATACTLSQTLHDGWSLQGWSLQAKTKSRAAEPS